MKGALTLKKGGEKLMKKQYICPMHPDVMADRPGSCPTCGMNLVPIKRTPADKAKADHCSCC